MLIYLSTLLCTDDYVPIIVYTDSILYTVLLTPDELHGNLLGQLLCDVTIYHREWATCYFLWNFEGTENIPPWGWSQQLLKLPLYPTASHGIVFLYLSSQTNGTLNGHFHQYADQTAPWINKIFESDASEFNFVNINKFYFRW